MILVAGEGVEPPTPAFSELVFPVFPTTSRVAVGLLNTGKYEKNERIVVSIELSCALESPTAAKPRLATPAMITYPHADGASGTSLASQMPFVDSC